MQTTMRAALRQVDSAVCPTMACTLPQRTVTAHSQTRNPVRPSRTLCCSRKETCRDIQRSRRCVPALPHTADCLPGRQMLCLELAPLFLLFPGVAFGADDVTYSAGTQSAFLQNLAGVLYVLLVAYLLYRVLTRRADKFTSEVCWNRVYFAC